MKGFKGMQEEMRSNTTAWTAKISDANVDHSAQTHRRGQRMRYMGNEERPSSHMKNVSVRNVRPEATWMNARCLSASCQISACSSSEKWAQAGKE